MGVITLTGIGTIAYFSLKKDTKTETKQITEQKVQQLQNQLSQIKNALTTLNQNIVQTESSLQTKRAEQVQTPHNNSLPTEINQLEQQLTTYQTQKQKIEAIIPKLEQQISSLDKGESDSEQKQEKIIQQLEQDIKKINQELGIKDEKPDEPAEKPDKKDKDPKPKPNPSKTPKNPDEPKKDNPKPDFPQQSNNNQQFENRKKWNKELTAILDKINKKYKEKFDSYDSKEEAVRETIDKLEFGGVKIKDFIESCRIGYNANNNNKNGLNDYFTFSECQAFTKLDEDSQKSKLELIDSIIESILSDIKRILRNDLNIFEKIATSAKMQELVNTTYRLNGNLIGSFKEDGSKNWIELEIKTIERVWKEMEKFDWGN